MVASDRLFEGVVPHPLYERDWSDAGFIKTWERNWVANRAESWATTYGTGQFLGIGSNVTRSQYSVPAAADGDQPGYSVPAISTDACVQCYNNDSESCPEGPSLTRYVAPGWKRVSISSSKTIHMHEDDNLTWYVDWGNLVPAQEDCGFSNVDQNQPCAMHIVPSLKIKVQYG